MTFSYYGITQDQGEGVRVLEAGKGESGISVHIRSEEKVWQKTAWRSFEDVQTFKTEGGENLSYVNITCIIII